MRLMEDKILQLFSGFMPQIKPITHRKNTEILCLQIYSDPFDYLNFDTNAKFNKWASVEITDETIVEPNMQRLDGPAGFYAVFLHTGLPSEFLKTYDYICLEWFPKSIYKPDNRPYFEVMGEKYKKKCVGFPRRNLDSHSIKN